MKEIDDNIGKPIKLDTKTSLAVRRKFARICFEVDLSMPLVTRVEVGNLSQAIEYEALHTLSFSYGIVGHRMDRCPSKPIAPATQTDNVDKGEAVDGGQSSREVMPTKQIYGTWMLVKRKFRKGSGSKGKQEEGGINSDSNKRFLALGSIDR